ncbi:uncharacterized protein LOC107428887 [Ziziphus jujuba]|uniref:Uncharacterized protein LOC107428887 n=1 Tax=Ziziphus jujuba TaxID=326968 RepID=A0A6P4ADX2_ZIZJJ|nr:uncharacterized protein LOC107428887 [Ziziphus jujuba]
MGSSSVSSLSLTLSQFSSITNFALSGKPYNPSKIFHSKTPKALTLSSTSSSHGVITKSVPLAASIAILLWSNPANAGFLSGFSGIESVPGPQLPQVDFLSRLNEENQKKYAENDARFKSSPIVKELLERSKLNKEKNRQQIEDKYCVRGAEWGVGDCSAEAMSPDDRDKFISMLKKKAGISD